jgi:hypothetical protein
MGRDVRVLKHAGRWRAPEATRGRKGVRVWPLRITDSCNLVLAPPKIVSMSDDQFTLAIGILAEMLADRVEKREGDSPSTNVVIRRVRD